MVQQFEALSADLAHEGPLTSVGPLVSGDVDFDVSGVGALGAAVPSFRLMRVHALPVILQERHRLLNRSSRSLQVKTSTEAGLLFPSSPAKDTPSS